MNGKNKALLAILCLFGTSFAWGGFGMDFGLGNLFGMGAGHDGGPQGTDNMQNVSVETRAEFMQATHEGDYETAMKLHDEYGLGGKKMDFATPQMFDLKAQIFNAQKLGNWVEAVVLQDKLVETVQSLMGEKKANCTAAFEENKDQIAQLQGQIKTAMESGDNDTVRELRGQLKQLMPEGCGVRMGMKGGQPPGMGGMPPQMNDTCRQAMQGNKDAVSSLRGQMKTAKDAGDSAKADELKAQIDALIPAECLGMQAKGMGGHKGEFVPNTE